MMTDKTDIPNCPHCGSKAELHPHECSIYCSSCACGATDYTISTDELIRQWSNNTQSRESLLANPLVQELLKEQREACADEYLMSDPFTCLTHDIMSVIRSARIEGDDNEDKKDKEYKNKLL